MVIKTFQLKNQKVKDVLRRIHALGIFDYDINWGVDMDEENNSITFRFVCTSGANAEEREKEIAKTIANFIKSIDVGQR